MEDDDLLGLVDCVGCGCDLEPGVDAAFPTEEGGYLCFACVARRAGMFDFPRGCWSRPSDSDDEAQHCA